MSDVKKTNETTPMGRLLEKVYVLSTPVLPAGFSGIVRIYTTTPGDIRRYLEDVRTAGRVQIISYCGHPASAAYLGVDVNRGELKPMELTTGKAKCVGIRPTRRVAPGEELAITDNTFEGFVMEVLSAALRL